MTGGVFHYGGVQVSIGDSLKRIREIRDLCSALKKEEESLKAEILSAMGDSKSLQAGDYLAVLKMSNRTSVDNEGIKRFMGEKYNEYVTTKPSTVLEVTKING